MNNKKQYIDSFRLNTGEYPIKAKDIPPIPEDIENNAVPTYNAETEDIQWKVPQGETSEKFIVNLTFKSQEVVGVSDVSMDKTVQEIVAAYKANKEIIIYADGKDSGEIVTHLKTMLPLTQIVDAEGKDDLVLGFSNLFYMSEFATLWNLTIMNSDSEDIHDYNFTISWFEVKNV